MIQYKLNSSLSWTVVTPITLHNSSTMSSTTVVDFVLMTRSVPPGNLTKIIFYTLYFYTEFLDYKKFVALMHPFWIGYL